MPLELTAHCVEMCTNICGGREKTFQIRGTTTKHYKRTRVQRRFANTIWKARMSFWSVTECFIVHTDTCTLYSHNVISKYHFWHKKVSSSILKYAFFKNKLQRRSTQITLNGCIRGWPFNNFFYNNLLRWIFSKPGEE